MNTYQRLPLRLVRGKGCWVWDEKGNRYLDAVAGIASCSLGHSDKKLRAVLNKQLTKIQHISNIFHICEQEELAQWLVNNSCGDSVFFCNSGAEANEAAIKLARKYGHVKRGIECPIILSAKSSFHGRTLAALSATGQTKYQKNFEPLVEGFEFFLFNNSNSLEQLKNKLEKDIPRICAVLIEPIQGEGGIHAGNKTFFKYLRDFCSENNILLIFDEVQSGMGRTGELWGYEHLGVEPDIFTLAKGLGGGHAIGALVAKQTANIFEPGDHASTFGGNPFACKAALTVGREIENRKLLGKIKSRGQEIREGLLRIISNYPDHFVEARGLGLMQGLEIKEESCLTSKSIVKKSIEEGLILIGAGPKVVRIVPPLIITKKQVNYLLKQLNKSIEKLIET
ncbi:MULTISPECIES: aspartate aminotransferase family protein [unclassified Prochlorococcus]|uniref:aspartate aminotransferase family protein n=1 Tax=unclassified Prochlorococcus TaxID=2627481 RepID=UPI00053398BF|nr:MULTISPECIES: aspartate aminotransferase family protein [unclassified Prochlorococcus]KGG16267.1 Acetylornithine aminotransferase [Prochlorococcus sp. MIT 0603]KGG17999.1 Acetylornithine aminotransferase [Prochlorococcus sp. MIT 0602]